MEPNCLISEKYLQQSFDFLSGHAVLLSFDSESLETVNKVTQYLNKMTRSTKFHSTLYLDNSNDFWLLGICF